MASKKLQQRGLGRGLSALMADVTEDSRESAVGSPRRPDLMVPVEKVHPNPEQPRRSFDAEQLQDLANSIAARGIIQPLIVRANPRRPGEYEIVAGERRWRAAQMAQLHEVPVLVRDFNDTEVLEVAIVENIQRADLNPVEEATGYNQLMHKSAIHRKNWPKSWAKAVATSPIPCVCSICPRRFWPICARVNCPPVTLAP